MQGRSRGVKAATICTFTALWAWACLAGCTGFGAGRDGTGVLAELGDGSVIRLTRVPETSREHSRLGYETVRGGTSAPRLRHRGRSFSLLNRASIPEWPGESSENDIRLADGRLVRVLLAPRQRAAADRDESIVALLRLIETAPGVPTTGRDRDMVHVDSYRRVIENRPPVVLARHHGATLSMYVRHDGSARFAVRPGVTMHNVLEGQIIPVLPPYLPAVNQTPVPFAYGLGAALDASGNVIAHEQADRDEIDFTCRTVGGRLHYTLRVEPSSFVLSASEMSRVTHVALSGGLVLDEPRNPRRYWVDTGGRLRLLDDREHDVTRVYWEVVPLAGTS